MPQSRQRKRTAARKAQQATARNEESEVRKLTPEQYMRRRGYGWALVAAGAAIAVTHWIAHLGFLYDATGVTDLAIGYPTGGLLAVLGAIVLSK